MNENYPDMNPDTMTEGTAAPDTAGTEPPCPKKDGATGKTVAALILGITSVMLSVTVVLGVFGLICGIVGLILAVRERKEHPTGMATASLILSVIGLAIGVLSTAACVGCIGLFGLLGMDYYDPGSYYYNDFFDTIRYF